MSRRDEWLKREIPKFIKEYTRTKRRIANDRHFDRKVLGVIQKIDPSELSQYLSGEVGEQELKDALSENKNQDSQFLWLKQRRKIRFSDIQILSIDASGIEYQDKQQKVSRIDFQECRKNLAENLKALMSAYKNQAFTWHREWVGHRDTRTKPPYIEFFTTPPSRFEFANSKKGRAELESFRVMLFDLGIVIA